MSENIKIINLLGKDYFTEKEAAHYCGVCDRHFRRESMKNGIFPIRHMGKKLYRRVDLQRSIENAAKLALHKG